MRRSSALFLRGSLCAAASLVFGACTESAKSSVMPTGPNMPVAPNFTKGLPNTDLIIDGTVGTGAVYRLFRPANWNGRLLVYAHGYVSLDQPVALPPEGSLFISLLGPQGVAVAFSSFSENGWNVKDGTQRTHQLLGTFTSHFGEPTHVYVGGASMGGLIAIKLTEKYPKIYSGSLAACSIGAGLLGLFDYQGNARALFDFFYPGVLPGNAAYLPPGTNINTGIVAPALAAITANPVPALTMARIDQVPFPGATPAEVVQSIVTALGSNAESLAELKELTNGKPYFENQDTKYSGALLPAGLLQAINAGVGRFDDAASAVKALARNYAPSGDLRIPMLMLSDARDPVVPGFNQASYLAAVTADGAQNLLVQRKVQAYGHCVFSPGDIATAFTDLVLWAEYGIKPAP